RSGGAGRPAGREAAGPLLAAGGAVPDRDRRPARPRHDDGRPSHTWDGRPDLYRLVHLTRRDVMNESTETQPVSEMHARLLAFRKQVIAEHAKAVAEHEAKLADL